LVFSGGMTGHQDRSEGHEFQSEFGPSVRFPAVESDCDRLGSDPECRGQAYEWCCRSLEQVATGLATTWNLRETSKVVSTPRAGGLHHRYHCQTAARKVGSSGRLLLCHIPLDGVKSRTLESDLTAGIPLLGSGAGSRKAGVRGWRDQGFFHARLRTEWLTGRQVRPILRNDKFLTPFNCLV
jgi:hypothetical protein